jgi:hypothetical protein
MCGRLTVCWKRFGERGCRSAQGVHSCESQHQIECKHMRIRAQCEMERIPFELVGEITGAGCGTKARDVEGGRGARHVVSRVVEVELRSVLDNGPVNIEQMRWDRNKVDKLVSNDDGRDGCGWALRALALPSFVSWRGNCRLDLPCDACHMSGDPLVPSFLSICKVV